MQPPQTESAGAVTVERDEVRVMFKRVQDFPAGIARAWADLEDVVGLRGRKFYGAVNRTTSEYWVCAQVREGDDPEALGLEVGTLPGGRYLRARLRGEPPGVYSQIGPTFEKLALDPASDPSRPCIEFYRQREQIDLLLPIT